MFLGAITICILLATPLTTAYAQVVPITPSGLNTQVNLSATPPVGKVQYDITGGSRPGGGPNLFHSFGEFGVPSDNIANFLNETALPTNNILSRVTGGNTSNIFGTIQTTGFGNANFFLMNPAGFLFGPTATINVGGLVAFTSADYLKLTDDTRFNAILNTAADALLTALPVASFGFLGSNPGAITVQGSHFSVTDGQSISLVGGNITIQSGVSDAGTAQSAQLSAPNGNILLASVASPGEFDAATLLPLPNVNGQSFNSLGSVTLTTGSHIAVSGTNNVSIRGGKFVLSVNDATLTTSQPPSPPETISLSPGSSIVASNSGEPGADIELIASNDQADGASMLNKPMGGGPDGNITLTNSIVSSSTDGNGNAGNILMVSNNLQAESTLITSSASAPPGLSGGNGGTIRLRIAQDAHLNNSRIDAQTIANGKAGNVFVDATSLTLNSSSLTTGTAPNEGFTGGDAGDIQVKVGQLTMHDGLIMSESTFSAGDGGTVTVTAMESITTSGSGIFPFAISTSTEGAVPFCPGTCGNAGSITLMAPTVVLNGVGLNSSTTGQGTAGNILAKVGNLTVMNGAQISASANNPGVVTGAGGNVTVTGLTNPAQSILIDGLGSGIFTDTEGTGAGGAIDLSARTLAIQNSGTISASTSGTTPNAIGGSITVNTTDSVTMTSGASIAASSTGPGDAGNISIDSDSLTIASGGRIEASTSGAGDGGSIAITTTGDVTVTGLSADGQVRSGIFAKTLSDGGGSGGGSGGGGGGSGGGSGPAATAPNPGSAGDITIDSKNLFLDGGAQIDSSTTSGGTGGTVSITTAENITIAGSTTRLTSDATRGNGKGGSLTLVAKNITVRDNASVTAATGGKGDAGNVSLTALDQLLLQSAGTVTTSTSGSGKGGTITIQASQVLLNGQGTAITADTLHPFADMTITIDILHPNDGDLVVQLDSPTGTRVALLSRVGGSGDNFTGTQLNDQATMQITSGSAPFTGTFTPREPLGQLNNELVAGNWALNVRDQATDNVGSLESWTLQIGQQTFQSTGGSIVIPDNDNIRSTITVANPTVPTVQGVGEPAGIGGNITLTASQSVTISDGASVSASSTGSGNAGNISINAGQQFEMRDSSVTTQATKASGGNVDIQAVERVRLVNSTISSSVQGDDLTSGGNITIDPNVVVLQNSQVTAQADRGAGGNIAITTPLFLADSGSLVSASSQLGVNGTVTIQSPTSNLSGSLGPLTSKPSQAQALLTQRCAALVNGQASSFVVAGREQLPADPGSWLTSPLAFAALSESLEADYAIASTPTIMPIVDHDTGTVSLRRLTPAGFLMANFAESEATGCRS